MQRAIDAVVALLIFMIAFTIIMYYYNSQYELSLKALQKTNLINTAENCALSILIDIIDGRVSLNELQEFNESDWVDFLKEEECLHGISSNRVYVEVYNITIVQRLSSGNVFISNPYMLKDIITPPWSKPNTYSALSAKSITLQPSNTSVLANIIVVKVYIA